jgi:predicted membrane metal-binding protein
MFDMLKEQFPHEHSIYMQQDGKASHRLRWAVRCAVAATICCILAVYLVIEGNHLWVVPVMVVNIALIHGGFYFSYWSGWWLRASQHTLAWMNTNKDIPEEIVP